MLDLLIRYAHFLGIMIVFASLFSEHLLLKPEIDKQTLKKLLVVDGVYGASAIVVFIMGGMLWFSVGKPAEFYSANPLLHVKVSLFILVGLLSIVPTVFFMKHRKVDAMAISVPKKIIMIIRFELALLLVIPLLAVLMAHGVGLN